MGKVDTMKRNLVIPYDILCHNFSGRKDRRLNRLHLPASLDIMGGSEDLLVLKIEQVFAPNEGSSKPVAGSHPLNVRLELVGDQLGLHNHQYLFSQKGKLMSHTYQTMKQKGEGLARPRSWKSLGWGGLGRLSIYAPIASELVREAELKGMSSLALKAHPAYQAIRDGNLKTLL
jgi:hypothetical protein